jgi:hypothetical protein
MPAAKRWMLVINGTRVETLHSVWSAMQYARKEFLIDWQWKPMPMRDCFVAEFNEHSEPKKAEIRVI